MSAPQVEPNFRENVGQCQCGLDSCTAYGTLKLPYKDGTRCVRGCPCKRCQGRNNKRKGARKQVTAVRGLGIPRSTISPGHEEFLSGPVRVEVKAGIKAKTVDTAYRLSRAQSDAARAVGDTRAFVAAFMPDGASHGYYVIRSDELETAAFALAEAFGGDA